MRHSASYTNPVPEGSSERRLVAFNVNVYTQQEPISNYLTAHGLRDFLNTHFAFLEGLTNSDSKLFVEVKYKVQQSQRLIKYIRSQQSMPFTIDMCCNRIDVGDFNIAIFSQCDDIKPLKAENDDDRDQTIGAKQKSEKEACDAIENALKTLTTIYNSSEFHSVLRSHQSQLYQVERSTEQIKIQCVMLLNKRQQQLVTQNIKNPISREISKLLTKNSSFYLKKNFRKKMGSAGKIWTLIDNWKIGLIKNEHYVPYFDIEVLKEKVGKVNESVRKQMRMGILRETTTSIRRFEVFAELFNGLIIKFEIKKVHIANIYSREEEDTQVYYIQLDFPPKFFAAVLNAKISNDLGYINTWKRIQNFTLLQHDQIRTNEFLRLHLFNNVTVRLQCKKNKNSKSRQFLNQLCSEMSRSFLSHPAKFVEGQHVFKNILNEVRYDKFATQLSNFSSVNSNQVEIKWNLKYLILCLLSRGLISAFQIQDLIEYVEEKKGYRTFVYIFDRMCDSDGKGGVKEIKRKYQDYQLHSEDLMGTDYDDDCLAVRIWRVQITPSGYLYCNKAPEMKSRMLREYSQNINHFMRAAILDDDGSQIKNQIFLSKRVFRNMISGFKVIERKLIPLGWSPSQLRSFSLWFVHEYQPSPTEAPFSRSQILNFLGEFKDISPPAKMAARIGQAFSSSWAMNRLKPIKVQEIDDIQVKNQRVNKMLNFTDGIGKISEDLMDELELKLELNVQLGAIQIRYLGVKGVLTKDPSLPKRTIVVRPSMLKYKCPHPNAAKHLDILDWNKFKSGFLNRQTIILLKSRGVKDEVFVGLQNQYVHDIKSLTYKECSIFKELTSDQYDQDIFGIDPANKIILGLIDAGFDLDNEPFFRGVMQILKRNGYEKLKQKSNIAVKKSARLIGIIDEFNVLNEKEIYCRVHDRSQKEGPSTISGDVIIVKNPCLHPADIRKLRCVSQKQIIQKFQGRQDHPFLMYPNTVIMPQQGKFPVTSAISGSDLDGDNFWICWQQTLTAISDIEPFFIIDMKREYAKNEITTIGDEEYKKMLDFFCDYMNYDVLGKIANSHLVKADGDLKMFANNQECVKLAQLHGHAVDFPKTGYCPPVQPPNLMVVNAYPDFMEKPDEQMYQSQSILGTLYRDIKQRIDTSVVENGVKKDTSLEIIDEDLISVRPSLDFSEKEIEQTLRIIHLFFEDMSRIKFLANLQSEFQIYTGNVTSKTKGNPKKNKGFKHGKLMEQIIMLKSKFQREFFKGFEEAKKDYLKSQQNMKDVLFPEEVRLRAALWYVTSYYEYFKEKLVCKPALSAVFAKFKQLVVKVKNDMGYENSDLRQLGLVWFTIPKVLMSMKANAVLVKAEIFHPIQQQQPSKKGDDLDLSRIDQSQLDKSDQSIRK